MSDAPVIIKNLRAEERPLDLAFRRSLLILVKAGLAFFFFFLESGWEWVVKPRFQRIEEFYLPFKVSNP